MLCHSPASLLEGGKGGAVSRPHQRDAVAMAGGGIGSQPQTSKGGMLCHSPASLLEGGGGTGAGGVLGIQPHYDLLFFTPTNRGVPGGCA